MLGTCSTVLTELLLPKLINLEIQNLPHYRLLPSGLSEKNNVGIPERPPLLQRLEDSQVKIHEVVDELARNDLGLEHLHRFFFRLEYLSPTFQE